MITNYSRLKKVTLSILIIEFIDIRIVASFTEQPHFNEQIQRRRQS